MYYFRTIDPQSWQKRDAHDSLTYVDLVPREGELSVWVEDGSEKSLANAALAFSLCIKKISDLYYVHIPDAILAEAGFTFRQENSKTPYIQWQDKHTNIVIHTIDNLIKMAEIIIQHIPEKEPDYVAEQSIREAFYDAISRDEVEIDFNSKQYSNLRKPLRFEEKRRKAPIDFSRLSKAKDVNTVSCPLCKGSGKVRTDHVVKQK